jgi:hypothetical protein
MTNFNEILNNLPKNFEEFYTQVIKLMELESLTKEQLQPVRDEITQLYTDALIETATKLLTSEDLDFVTGYSLLNPTVSELDVYFAIASEKPNVDEMLKNVLTEVFERLNYLKSKYSSVK